MSVVSTSDNPLSATEQKDSSSPSRRSPLNSPGSDVRPVNPEELTKLIQDAAASDVHALRRLGEVYFFGKVEGQKTDFDKALTYFKQGADLGDAASLFYLGKIYELGLGSTPKNMPEALEKYKKSAEKRYQPALEQLIKLHKPI